MARWALVWESWALVPGKRALAWESEAQFRIAALELGKGSSLCGHGRACFCAAEAGGGVRHLQ